MKKKYMGNNYSEEQLIDLFGKLDDKYVSLPLEEVVAKQIERETSGFEEDDSQSENNTRA